MALIELKCVIFEVKNKTNKISCRIDTTREQIGKLESTAIKVSQTEEREKKWLKNKQKVNQTYVTSRTL